MKLKNIIVILFAIILLISCKLAQTDNDYINVPNDYPTIQKAVDSASKGYTILIELGT